MCRFQGTSQRLFGLFRDFDGPRKGFALLVDDVTLYEHDTDTPVQLDAGTIVSAVQLSCGELGWGQGRSK